MIEMQAHEKPINKSTDNFSATKKSSVIHVNRINYIIIKLTWFSTQ